MAFGPLLAEFCSADAVRLWEILELYFQLLDDEIMLLQWLVLTGMPNVAVLGHHPLSADCLLDHIFAL